MWWYRVPSGSNTAFTTFFLELQASCHCQASSTWNKQNRIMLDHPEVPHNAEPTLLSPCCVSLSSRTVSEGSRLPSKVRGLTSKRPLCLDHLVYFADGELGGLLGWTNVKIMVAAVGVFLFEQRQNRGICSSGCVHCTVATTCSEPNRRPEIFRNRDNRASRIVTCLTSTLSQQDGTCRSLFSACKTVRTCAQHGHVSCGRTNLKKHHTPTPKKNRYTRVKSGCCNSAQY